MASVAMAVEEMRDESRRVTVESLQKLYYSASIPYPVSWFMV
jgi:hypothetical protein